MDDTCPNLFDPDAWRAWRQRRRVAQTWGDFLNQYVWAHFVTLTTEVAMSADRLRHEFVSRLTCATQRRVPYSWVVERGLAGMRLHLHALVAGTASLETPQLQWAWKAGRAKIEAYDRARGVAHYLAKTIGVVALGTTTTSRVGDRHSSSKPATACALIT